MFLLFSTLLVFTDDRFIFLSQVGGGYIFQKRRIFYRPFSERHFLNIWTDSQKITILNDMTKFMYGL